MQVGGLFSTPIFMITQEIELPWGFPTLNDLLNITARHWSQRHKSKKQWQGVCKIAIRQGKLKPLAGAVDVTFIFFPPNARRDPDNASAVVRKFMLDSLQEEGIIEQDNWRGIAGLHDRFEEPDKVNPRIIMRIKGNKK